jgi:hypothetical protein
MRNLGWIVPSLIVGVVAAAAALACGGVVDRPDDTATIQNALDRLADQGGVLRLPAGKYRIQGSLTIPTGVSLLGSWEGPNHGAWDQGSTLLIVGGRGREDGPAAIELRPSSAIKGFTLLWPDQKWNEIVPYPWAIRGNANHATVENITLVNAYQGIQIGPNKGEAHLIRNVFGCMLRRGISIDATSDIGRIENVHIIAHYWNRSRHASIPHDRATASALNVYTQSHLEGFIFARADWEYVLNTFVYAAKVGYRFIKSPAGACNGQLAGIGADRCRACVQIDAIQNLGLQVSNGEFTSAAGAPDTGILTGPDAGGAVQFVNCNFWSNVNHAAWLRGETAVTFANCHFINVAEDTILAERGKLIVQGCNFRKPNTAIALGPDVSAAVIMGNLQTGGLKIQDQTNGRVQIGLNERAPTITDEQARHYEILIGSPGDEGFLQGGWYDAETSSDAPKVGSTCRWTSGRAGLRLAVAPGRDATLLIWLKVDRNAVGQKITVDNRPAITLDRPGLERVLIPIPQTWTRTRRTVPVTISGPTWSPHQLDPAKADVRALGVKVFRIELIANGGNSLPLFKANGLAPPDR